MRWVFAGDTHLSLAATRLTAVKFERFGDTGFIIELSGELSLGGVKKREDWEKVKIVFLREIIVDDYISTTVD